MIRIMSKITQSEDFKEIEVNTLINTDVCESKVIEHFRGNSKVLAITAHSVSDINAVNELHEQIVATL